jgi:hypothetical protein
MCTVIMAHRRPAWLHPIPRTPRIPRADMDGTTGSDACPDWLTCDTDTGRHTWPHGNGISKRKALRAASAGELKHRPVTPTDRASRTKQGQARRSTTRLVRARECYLRAHEARMASRRKGRPCCVSVSV